VKKWNAKIAEGDAYLFVTPEYNHSVPAVLKNAIDSVFATFAFRGKPAAYVGYSGGTRAIEHLAHVAIEAEMVPLRNSVIIPSLQGAFGPVSCSPAAGAKPMTTNPHQSGGNRRAAAGFRSGTKAWPPTPALSRSSSLGWLVAAAGRRPEIRKDTPCPRAREGRMK